MHLKGSIVRGNIRKNRQMVTYCPTPLCPTSDHKTRTVSVCFMHVSVHGLNVSFFLFFRTFGPRTSIRRTDLHTAAIYIASIVVCPPILIYSINRCVLRKGTSIEKLAVAIPMSLGANESNVLNDGVEKWHQSGDNRALAASRQYAWVLPLILLFLKLNLNLCVKIATN